LMNLLEKAYSDVVSGFCEVTLNREGATPLFVRIEMLPSVDGLECRAAVLDVTERHVVEVQRKQLIQELQDAAARIKVLSGLLPICAYCKKIRDDQGYWKQLEAYITHHSEASFSHGICPACVKEQYPQFDIDPNTQ